MEDPIRDILPPKTLCKVCHDHYTRDDGVCSKCRNSANRTPSNPLERIIKTEAEKNGWTVLTNGWPDQLWVKNGIVKFVEVKDQGDKIRPNQEKLLIVLANLGLQVRIAGRGPGYGDSEDSKKFHLLCYPFKTDEES